jgi:hypothetical protein
MENAASEGAARLPSAAAKKRPVPRAEFARTRIDVDGTGVKGSSMSKSACEAEAKPPMLPPLPLCQRALAECAPDADTAESRPPNDSGGTSGGCRSMPAGPLVESVSECTCRAEAPRLMGIPSFAAADDEEDESVGARETSCGPPRLNRGASTPPEMAASLRRTNELTLSMRGDAWEACDGGGGGATRTVDAGAGGGEGSGGGGGGGGFSDTGTVVDAVTLSAGAAGNTPTPSSATCKPIAAASAAAVDTISALASASRAA